jgi:hypothetical protein
LGDQELESRKGREMFLFSENPDRFWYPIIMGLLIEDIEARDCS